MNKMDVLMSLYYRLKHTREKKVKVHSFYPSVLSTAFASIIISVISMKLTLN